MYQRERERERERERDRERERKREREAEKSPFPATNQPLEENGRRSTKIIKHYYARSLGEKCGKGCRWGGKRG